MSKKLAITLITVAFFVGGIGGWFVAGYSYGQFFVMWCAQQARSDAGLTVGTLKHLQANDITNAIEALEVSLDGSLSMLGATADHISKEQRDSESKVIQQAKDYRTKFPRKLESTVQEEIEHALSLVATNTAK